MNHLFESCEKVIKRNDNNKSHAAATDSPLPRPRSGNMGAGMLAAVETGHALPRDSCEARSLPEQVSTTHDKTHAGQCAQEHSSRSFCSWGPRWKHLQTCARKRRAEL